MNPPRLPLLAVAVLTLAACSDRTPTGAHPTIPAPRLALVDGACALSTFSSSFTPALDNVDRAVTAETETSYSCTLGASSGSSFTTVERTVNCQDLVGPTEPMDEVITWTGGTGAATSTIRYTSDIVTVGATTYLGSVTAGRFAGDAVTKVVQITSFQGSGIPLLCAAGLGTVTRIGGPAALTIVDTTV